MDEQKNTQLPPAIYANFLRVAQNRSEFFLAFGQLAKQQVAGAHLVSSVVTSPAHAKSMVHVLGEAVRRYEERFGPIPDLSPPAVARGSEAASGAGAGPVGSPGRNERSHGGAPRPGGGRRRRSKRR